MSSTTSTATVRKLNEVFSRFGVPHVIVSDNGTQFTSHQFQNFCKTKGINHLTCSPFHPQSNGQAERFVDTFKRAILKIKGEEVDHDALQIFLACYRSTPNPAAPNRQSPAEALFGRPMRTVLSLLHPQPRDRYMRNTQMEEQFNAKHGAVRREYQPQDDVYVRDYVIPSKVAWTAAVVLERRGTVIYTVRTCNNMVWRRHANQMRPRPSNDQPAMPVKLPLQMLLDEYDVPAPVSIPVDNSNTHHASENNNTRAPISDLHNTDTQTQLTHKPQPRIRQSSRIRRPTPTLSVTHDARQRYQYL